MSMENRVTTKTTQRMCYRRKSPPSRWNMSEGRETTSGDDTGLNVDVEA